MKKIKETLMLLLVILLSVSQNVLKSQVKEKKDNWHDQIFRKLFFDYHNHMNNWGLAENFDAEKWLTN